MLLQLKMLGKLFHLLLGSQPTQVKLHGVVFQPQQAQAGVHGPVHQQRDQMLQNTQVVLPRTWLQEVFWLLLQAFFFCKLFFVKSFIPHNFIEV